jgi:hypothetical protein
VDAPSTRATPGIGLRDARSDELDGLSRLLEAVYGEFQPHFPSDLWQANVGEIADVRGSASCSSRSSSRMPVTSSTSPPAFPTCR